MKELLVVIDYQNDFVNGALGFEGAEKLDGPIVEKIREYRRRGADVIFTRDTHRENYLETQEGRRLPVVHCIEGSHGHKIFGETAKQVQIGDMIIGGPRAGRSSSSSGLPAQDRPFWTSPPSAAWSSPRPPWKITMKR